ncbi:MAG: NPXTG-anchored protein, partial [Oscillospiraceae bacterium]|nr:NPXTG-anchored protein [Oscillospiraceae bacterium]
DETPETFEAVLKLNTATAWGDYQIDVETAPEDLGAIYGAILKTQEGNAYAMRHEQNIWRGEFAWSSGIKTTEPHGNTLDYENFESLMGETVTEIVYITKSGYVTTVNDGLYIPVKFTNTLEVTESTAGTGTTELKMENFPDDYAPEFAIADQFTVSGNEISYTDALPGSYTLQVSDQNQKYADFSTSFILSTEDLPVVYDKEAGKLIPAEGSTEEDAANFIKNLSVVNLNDQNYTASGRGAVKIVGEDGTVDFNAENRGEAIFDGSGNYNLTFTATGYTNPLSVTLTAEQPTETPTESTTNNNTNNTNNNTNNTTTNRNTSSSNTSSNSNSSAATSNSANTSNTSNNSNTSDTSATASPKTGDSAGIPLIALAAAGLTAIFAKKKK